MVKRERLKWGVLGAGGIARRRTIPEGFITADNARLVAVCGSSAELTTEIAREFDVRGIADLDEFLRSDIDAVYIATPAHLHAAQTIQAASAGKHILCEKPLGLSVSEATAMVNACEASRVRLGTALMMRFHGAHRTALQMLRDGCLGEPVFARAQLSCWYPPIPGAWRQDPRLAGGGSLMDMGGHCLDLLELFLGPVVEASCFTANRIQSYPSEDSAVATLRFENGALGVVDAFFCIPDASSRNVLEIYGSLGSLLATGTIGQAADGSLTHFAGDPAGYSARQERGPSGGVTLEFPAVNTYRAEIEEFSAAVLEGRMPENSHEIGLRSQLLMEACYSAATTKRTVRILAGIQSATLSEESK